MSTPNKSAQKTFDLFVIGGGINGAGIARDAVGRGYSVALAEMNDFASATSSSSTKLFHGGLRYLEFFEFRLVREALVEREVLLKAMPHIAWPMRFVLPIYPEMRFESDTPTSRLLSWVMPWMKGRRPAWLIRLGLFLYDNLGGRKILPGTASLDLRREPEGKALKAHYQRAYEYSDCWVEDSRLTLLNVKDAQDRGAKIMARTKVTAAVQERGLWTITTEAADGTITNHRARMIVNAGGPWVEDIIQNVARLNTTEGVRLVRGSHIVTKKLFDHDKCYFFQGTDGRIMFAIPYEEDFTLIGTTDAEHDAISEKPLCTDEEADYMLAFVNAYFEQQLSRDDIVWTYSGVRPLYDDGARSATAATRDYVMKVNTSAGAPVLNIFGGKITTYRRLAESALAKINETLDRSPPPWTAGETLWGGDVAVDGIADLQAALAEKLPFFDGFTIRRLIRQYGTQAAPIFDGATDLASLGENFGHGVTAHEVDWAMDHEWVATADDFLWRRSKLGIRFTAEEKAHLAAYIDGKNTHAQAA
ncbi:MAG: glycerol-3-phosphate dehydrogenase [Pseudomonadota bacterium]